MAAAVSSRSRGAAGGLFFLFTLLGLVCTAASLMDENLLYHALLCGYSILELLRAYMFPNVTAHFHDGHFFCIEISQGKTSEAEQDLDTLKARRDTASELSNGFMSLLDPTMVFMRKAAEGSPEFSALTEEYLKSTKVFMETCKSLLDGDALKLDAHILKLEQDLRASKKIVQSQEEQHAEL
ncbi:hypothetical protein KUCAC02_035612 [Chaenocephalus aceratus]|nr:hypothetical protein KUCAC02_035612 [Chaenocephalus aceratus]